MVRLASLLLSILLLLPHQLPAQSPPPLTLIVEGVARNVTAATVRSIARDSASLTFHDQPAVMYSGYPLAALLRTAGVRTDSLRGPALSSRLVFEAADGYRVVLTLADLDPSLGGRRVLIADRMNGEPLPASEAPWRLIVVGDHRPARSARQVLRIRVASEAR